MAAATPRQWVPLQKQLLPQPKGAEREAGALYQHHARRRQREALEEALKKGYLRQLDRDLILASQVESEGAAAPVELCDVRRVSLSGRNVQALDDIALLSCARLRVVNLASCFLRDIGAFYGCTSLLKLDVSDNQIERLPSSDFWSSLPSLRVLYLSGNAVSSRACLSSLGSCPCLHILTLHDTPLALVKNYRHHVVNSVFSLRALDRHVVSDEEIVENLCTGGRFNPLSSHFRIHLYHQCPKGSSYCEEVAGVFAILLAVARVLAHHSPVTIIQRWVRGWLLRRTLDKSSDSKLTSLVLRNRQSRNVGRAMHGNTSTQVPLAQTALRHGKTKIRKTHSNSVPSSSSIPPAPPPSSPLHHVSSRRQRHGNRRGDTKTPLDTIILRAESGSLLGAESGSLKIRYSVHVNLQKLQRGSPAPEGEWSQRSSPAHRMAMQKSSQAVLLGAEIGLTTALSCGLASALSCAPEQHSASDPLHESPLQETRVERERKEEREGGGREIGKITNVSSGKIEVSGHTVVPTEHDFTKGMAESKKEEGSTIREAEKVIKTIVSKTKQPPLRKTESHKSEIKGQFTRDKLMYNRVCDTMTLSTLKGVERAREVRQKANTLVEKSSLVSAMKRERLKRKHKVDAYHAALRDRALSSRALEEDKKERLTEQMEVRREEEEERRAEALDTITGAAQARREEEAFAGEFNQQVVLFGSTLSQEDRKLAAERRLQAVWERVAGLREASREQCEVVQRYLDLRERRLLHEGAHARQQLDATMLQAASLRMIEAKQRVSREVARKQTARAAMALARERLLAGRSDPAPSSSSPPSPDGVRHGIRHAAVPRTEPATAELDRLWKERARVHRLPRAVTKRGQAGGHLDRMTKEAHHTWQRGCKVMTEREKARGRHFPTIAASADTPLMYDMMCPGPTLLRATPTDGAASLSGTSSCSVSVGPATS